MANKKRLGGECYLYRNSGTYASPTWNILENMQDVSLPMSKGRGEFKTRGCKWILGKGGKIDAGIEGKLIYDPGDDDLIGLRDAFLNNTAIEFACLDGLVATPTTQGLRVMCDVVDFPLDQPLEEGVSIAIKIKPTISDNDPAWMIVT